MKIDLSISYDVMVTYIGLDVKFWVKSYPKEEEEEEESKVSDSNKHDDTRGGCNVPEKESKAEAAL